MAIDTKNSLSPTAELFEKNPLLARAIQIYWFAQWYHKDEIAKTFALLDVNPNKITLEDERSRQALLEFAKRFELDHPDKQTVVEKVVPTQTVETGLTYAEKIYGEAQRKKFVEQLTDNYIQQLRKQKVNLGDPKIAQPPIRKEIADRVEEIVKTTSDPTQVAQKIQQELTSMRGLPARPDQVATAAAATTKEFERSAYFLTNQQSVVSAINTAILRAPVERKDVYAQVLTALVAEDPSALTSVEGVERTTKQAMEFERVGATLISDYLPDPAKLNIGTEKFFRSYAKTGTEKISAVVADGLMKLMSPERQWEIAEAFLGKSFDKVMADTDTLTRLFGEGFVGSDLYNYLIQNSNRTFAGQKGSMSSGMQKIRGSFDDIVTPIIRGPIEPLVGTPDQHILDIIKLNQMGVFSKETLGIPHPSPAGDRPLVRGATSYTAEFTSANVPSQLTVFTWHARDVFFSMIHKSEANHHAFEFLSDLGGWIFNWGAKEGAKKAASTVAGEGAKRGLAALLTKVGLSGLAGILTGGTSWLAQAALWLGGSFLGKAWGGLRNLLSLSWILGSGEKGKWTDDVALVMAIVLVGFIPIIMLIVLFQTVTKDTSFLMAGIGGGITDETFALCDPGIDPQCALSPCNQSAQDCSWPVSTGCVNQGPGGGPTHEGLNAIDIKAEQGTVVTATHNGTTMGCGNDGGHYNARYGVGVFDKGYGNVVQIKGTDEKGNTYSTVYAHLEKVSVTPCQTVQKGDPIGTVDDTGFSSGNHLHYEYRGGGSINTILPPYAIGTCIGGRQ
ncbi:M23 family metallopeptidase [Candidatus Gottesmanbacteria bacterium]|nr:M23 family metallopeptidase [Candidatus Gottesmanbacteria bacterium]